MTLSYLRGEIRPVQKDYIFADFNNTDTLGRLRLSVKGAVDCIREQNLRLYDGMPVTVSDEDEFTVNGIARWNDEEKIWVVEIDWEQLN